MEVKMEQEIDQARYEVRNDRREEEERKAAAS